MRYFVIFAAAVLIFSCGDVEKKYEKYKINREVKHFDTKEVKLKSGITVHEYDGVKSYSDFGLKDLYQNEEELTFMVWFNPSVVDTMPIIDNYANSLWLKKDGFITYNFHHKKELNSNLIQEFAKSSSKYAPNKWFLLVAVYKKDQYSKIYINGKIENTNNNINGKYGENFKFTDIYVGKSDLDKKRFFNGKIDTENINIYNKELSEKDIKSYYNKMKVIYK